MVTSRYSSHSEWKGAQVVLGAARGSARGVNLALERLRAVSVPRTPIDTGLLRSAFSIIDATEPNPEGVLVVDTPYAAKQHEELAYQHDEGQAKYVEEPMADHQAELLALIAREVSLGIVHP